MLCKSILYPIQAANSCDTNLLKESSHQEFRSMQKQFRFELYNKGYQHISCKFFQLMWQINNKYFSIDDAVPKPIGGQCGKTAN